MDGDRSAPRDAEWNSSASRMTPRLDLRQLRYFLAVAEEGSFSAAAERLHMAQPPLSQAISKLERSLNTRLFERQPRRPPRLTPQGAMLVSEASRILQQVRDVESLLRGHRFDAQLRIGAIPSVIAGLMTSVIPRFRAANPTVRILLSETEERDFLGAIKAWSVDIGFTRATKLAPGYSRTPLMLEPLYAVVDSNHRLATRSSIDIAELSDEDFVIFVRDDAPNAYDHIIHACIRGGFTPRILLHAKNDLAMLSFVACGLVVTLVPFLSTIVKQPGVSYLRVQDWAVSPLSLVHRRGADNPYLYLFEVVVRERLAELTRAAGIELVSDF